MELLLPSVTHGELSAELVPEKLLQLVRGFNLDQA
jgi:hypothetical protein